MLIAAMSTIPERRDTFVKVVRRILDEQSQAVDRLHVYLHRFDSIPSEFPRDRRIHYEIEPRGAGSWARYLFAQHLDDGDVFATLDDDTAYPENYLEAGVSTLVSAEENTMVSFGGIVWDPLTVDHSYGNNAWRILASSALDRPWTVAFPMGLVSFFKAWMLKGIISLELPGFNTNDDMLIALGLQRRGIRITCPPKRGGWIGDLDTAHGAEALYRWDRGTRYSVFREMVGRLGFDPTAGGKERVLEAPSRALVLGEPCPPLEGSEALDATLLPLLGPGRAVHLLGAVRASRVPRVVVGPNLPYEVHAVSIPEEGGRFDGLAAVRRWRNWRVARERRHRWARRVAEAMERLRPTESWEWRAGGLVRRSELEWKAP